MKNQVKKSFLKTAAAAAVALTLSGHALADVSIYPDERSSNYAAYPRMGQNFPSVQ